MAVQFDYVFSGEAGGGGEIEQKAIIDGFTCGIDKIGVERTARLRGFAAADLLRQRQQLLAGKPDNAHPALPGGSGNGGDGGNGWR